MELDGKTRAADRRDGRPRAGDRRGASPERGASAGPERPQGRGARGARGRRCRARAPGRRRPTSPSTGAAERLAAEAGEVDVPRRQRRPARRRGGSTSFTPERGRAGAARQPRGADAAGAGALPGDGRARRAATSSSSPRSPASRRRPRASIYNATKFGLRGFALGLRADLDRTASASRSSRPGSSATRGCSPTSGAKPPPGMGTAHAGSRWRAAWCRAIERDKVEVAVAPLRQRALAHLGLVSPGARRARRRAATRRAEGGGRGRRRARRTSGDRCDDEEYER